MACAIVLMALMWKSGSVVPSTSHAPTPRMRAVLRPHAAYCPCGTMTPLAGPVVPDV
jgi:hypothetical protein